MQALTTDGLFFVQLNTPISTTNWKHPALPENQNPSPTDIVVKKKCTNTLAGKCGQLTTYTNCSQIESKGGEKKKITVKGQNIMFTQKNIALMLDLKISILESPKNSTDQWSQDYALSTVISGANKNLSQATTVHLYETATGGVWGYQKTVLGDLELNGKKIPPPQKLTLNEHNISQFQNELLMAYKQLSRSDSPCNSLRSSFAKYYSISNDGIQKFSIELNGVIIRTLNDDLKITNIPWQKSMMDLWMQINYVLKLSISYQM